MALEEALANRVRTVCEASGDADPAVVERSGRLPGPHRSLVKAAQLVRREANRLMVALWEGGLEATMSGILRQRQSGCRIEKRKLFPSMVQRLEGTPVFGASVRSSPRIGTGNNVGDGRLGKGGHHPSKAARPLCRFHP